MLSFILIAADSLVGLLAVAYAVVARDRLVRARTDHQVFVEDLLWMLSKSGGATLANLGESAYSIARDHGWYITPPDTPTRIALMHSELSEALEEYRAGHALTEVYERDGKPEGYPIELADVIIRILDHCTAEGIDIQGAVLRKMEYNATRPHRHGGKVV
ncbi:MAG TPA: hypothetical protein VFW98_08455 [Gemmatimonadaceae bacterium]|nr:hypothetical protein [Gemmatimonadaceae bacterium]